MRRTTFFRHLARAVVTSLVRNTGPLRKAVASPNDADELAWGRESPRRPVDAHDFPWPEAHDRHGLMLNQWQVTRAGRI